MEKVDLNRPLRYRHEEHMGTHYSCLTNGNIQIILCQKMQNGIFVEQSDSLEL